MTAAALLAGRDPRTGPAPMSVREGFNKGEKESLAAAKALLGSGRYAAYYFA